MHPIGPNGVGRQEFFEWTEGKRVDFLKLQNSLIEDGGKLSDVELLQLAHDNHSSNESIRTMMDSFNRETATNRFPAFPPAPLTVESVDSGDLQSKGGGFCGPFFPSS